MSIESRLPSWLQRLWNRRPKKGFYPKRREFVYLDEVSVLSILASKKGGIAAEFTETQTASQNSEVMGSIGVGLGGTKANLGAKMQAGQVEATQVLRKAIIQTSFKELYESERSALVLYLTSPNDPPAVDSLRDLERLLDSSEDTGLLVDPRALHRGDLLEVEVELEADPIFHLTTIITFFSELMEDNEELNEKAVTAQLPEIRSIARLLEKLLAGLVPIRGRLVDYECIRIRDRDILVRQSLLGQIPIDERPKAYPVILVGVGLSDLFWKDIRRVLFSKSRYTVFCRLATSGLTDRWNPVKMADVFSGIATDFDEMIQGLGDELMMGFKESVRPAATRKTADAPPAIRNQDATRGERILQKYAESLANRHTQNIEPAALAELIREVPREENWLDSVDDHRKVFTKVTEKMDELLAVKTSPDEALELRTKALKSSRREETVKLDGSTVSDNRPEPRCERYLDAEIIAIYW